MQYSRLDSTAPGFDCDNSVGWYYTDEATTDCELSPFSCDNISLCGAACVGFKAQTPPTAEVTYFCNAG